MGAVVSFGGSSEKKEMKKKARKSTPPLNASKT